MEQKIVSLNKAVEIIRDGGIIIYPTDTAFGIGCRMDKPKSVERLFKIRKRPQDKAVPVLVNSIEMVMFYFTSLPDIVRRLMETYWPGAVTVVYTCRKELVSPLVRGGGETLGLRMPNHKVPLEIIEKVGVPLLGPSANYHSLPTPYKIEDLDIKLLKDVDGVIKGVCPLGRVSTVVDCTKTPFKIIRYGAQLIDKSFLT